MRAAKSAAEKDPGDPENWIKLGRAYRTQQLHGEAISAYSTGVTYEPLHPLLYWHRGHSYINIAKYAEAAADFEFALRLDPSSFDCWYHLGFAYYLMGEYERAIPVFQSAVKCLDSINDLISTTTWHWFCLVRLGRGQEAQKILEQIPEDLRSGGRIQYYYYLLLLYKGLRKPEKLVNGVSDNVESHTTAYGVAVYYESRGDLEKAENLIDLILSHGDRNWSSFGYQATLSNRKRRDRAPL